jgi:hypothetical protein
MTWKHKPTEITDDYSICLHDHEPWPCAAEVIKREVIAEVIEIVQPTGAEPRCCDVCADRHTVRDDLVEEIKGI